jgi:hypothetical protein
VALIGAARLAGDDVYRAVGNILVQHADGPLDNGDFFEWHPCPKCPNADPAGPGYGRCACSGEPWPSPLVRLAVDTAVRLTEQRIREQLAGEYLESVNLLVAQQAARTAQLERQLEAKTYVAQRNRRHVAEISADYDAMAARAETAEARAAELERRLGMLPAGTGGESTEVSTGGQG